ncbi:hypothetical protein GGR57DRAFT_5369 [Xylariaceae sp. FL1272]|nr:hypothetical protein GGR57DRAFT_5369 [Xylariaceae sp. FL1272]
MSLLSILTLIRLSLHLIFAVHAEFSGLVKAMPNMTVVTVTANTTVVHTTLITVTASVTSTSPSQRHSHPSPPKHITTVVVTDTIVVTANEESTVTSALLPSISTSPPVSTTMSLLPPESTNMTTPINNNTTLAIITAAPTSTFNTGLCGETYCQDDTSFCVYWAGFTSWDISNGPVPGMVHTSIGVC